MSPSMASWLALLQGLSTVPVFRLEPRFKSVPSKVDDYTLTGELTRYSECSQKVCPAK
jgi:hypothetical protein